MLYLDIKTSLVDEMLVKSDRMTMNQGIEGRVPFLDHRLVEFAMSIPSTLKIQNGFGKMPLRKLVEKKLGSALAYREKTGFNSPLKKLLVEDKITLNDFNNKIEVLEDQQLIDKNALSNFKASIPKGDFQPSTAFGLYALAQFIERA
jgi:asparagine synthase (glutamine-hydrolysing)